MHQENVNSAAFSPDRQRVVTASGDHPAWVWDAATGKAIAQRYSTSALKTASAESL